MIYLKYSTHTYVHTQHIADWPRVHHVRAGIHIYLFIHQQLPRTDNNNTIIYQLIELQPLIMFL